MRLTPHTASVLSLAVAVFLGSACASTQRAALPSSSPVLVHSVFLSGGDAPFAQVVTVFEDGSVSVAVASAPSRSFRLDPREAAELRAIVASESFAAALAAARVAGRSCCDHPELAISTSVSRDRIGQAGPHHAWFNLTQGHGPPSVAQFIGLLNAVGTGYLGPHFHPVRP